MLQRFTLDDLRNIGYYLGVLIFFSSVIYAVPLITAICFFEWEPAFRYLLTMGICLCAGGLLRLLRIAPTRLSRQQALAVTGLAWIVLALFASIPLFMSGHYASYLDAVFDGVSGITTTGASVIQDLDHLSNADNMFRFMMHLIGGLGLIVVALSLGLFSKGGASSLYSSEARSEHVIPNIMQTARFILRLSLGFILVATFILTVVSLIIGMEPARAVLHSFWLSITSFMTGGFAPTSESVMHYHSILIELILMILMVFGAINFTLHSEVWKGRVENLVKDLEIRTMIIWVAVITALFAISICTGSEFDRLPAMLRRGVFSIVAAFTTTGLLNMTPNELLVVLPSGAFLILSMAMAVGGGIGSTAGGIKINRMGLVAKSIAASIKAVISPDSAKVVVTYNHLGRRTLSQSVSRDALTVFVLFIITYVIGSLVGMAYGYDATRAIFESIAMTSNGGLSTIVSAGMPVGLEIVYILQMWAGRLEFITLIALIVQLVSSIMPRRRVKR